MSNARSIRYQLAVESARLMSESGVNDFLQAKKKAARKLGIQVQQASLPSNEEILEQLNTYNLLYQPEKHAELLKSQRTTALKIMQLFHAYQPRLTGAVLMGHANSNSSIDIHVYADTSEEIAFILMDNNIPYQPGECKMLFRRNNPVYFPIFQFMAGEHAVNIIVITSHQKNIPLSPVNHQAMERASIKQLEQMLSQI